jgi:hypothetical protein
MSGAYNFEGSISINVISIPSGSEESVISYIPLSFNLNLVAY